MSTRHQYRRRDNRRPAAFATQGYHICSHSASAGHRRYGGTQVRNPLCPLWGLSGFTETASDAWGVRLLRGLICMANLDQGWSRHDADQPGS